MTTFRLGLIQLAVGANKAANVQRACDKVREAAAAAFQRCPARAQVRAVGPIDRRTGPRVDWLLRA